MTVWLAAAALAACSSPGHDRSVDAAPRDAPAGDALVSDGSPSDAAPIDAPSDPARLRLISGNLTSGNLQAYQDPGIRIFRGLAPDVAMIQELNFASDSPADLRAFVDQAFGA